MGTRKRKRTRDRTRYRRTEKERRRKEIGSGIRIVRSRTYRERSFRTRVACCIYGGRRLNPSPPTPKKAAVNEESRSSRVCTYASYDTHARTHPPTHAVTSPHDVAHTLTSLSAALVLLVSRTLLEALSYSVTYTTSLLFLPRVP